jgi:ribonuclease HI
MSEPALLSIHTDGASRGNPGEAAFAYTIARDGMPTVEEAGCLGRITNNQAEYTALVRALEHALRLGPENRLLVHSDSELMVKQMRGEYKVKNEDLRDLYEQARRLVRQFTGSVTFKHVRREFNKRTDELCNQALDGACGAPAAKEKRPVKVVAEIDGDVHDAALACLREAGALPDAETAWKELQGVLRKHGIKVPARQR